MARMLTSMPPAKITATLRPTRSAANAGELTFGPAEFDRHVLAFEVTAVAQALAERLDEMRVGGKRPPTEESDDRHRRLRERGERRHNGAAEQRDEIAPSHRDLPAVDVQALIVAGQGIWLKEPYR
jgi:hypothetical protein